MTRLADLHIHTHFSDSTSSPQEVVQQAHENGLSCISITDHDTIDGIHPTSQEAKKYDIEVYMAHEKAYKEVVSCSNCISYQATRLNIKFQTGKEKEYIHTLNCTAVATSRTLRAILENYQQKDGSVKIPAVLVPYMDGKKVLGK